jgi:hypothetical protein
LPNKAEGKMNPKEPKQFVSVAISIETHNKLMKLAEKQGFITKQGYPSRAQAVDYLIKNFEAPIE